MYPPATTVTSTPLAPPTGPSLYLHTALRSAEAALDARLDESGGVVVLTGAAGVGKSTLMSRAVARLRAAGTRAACVVTTHLGPAQLLRTVAFELGAGEQASPRLTDIKASLVAQVVAQRGQPVLVAVDEANNLPDESLRALLGLVTEMAVEARRLEQTRPGERTPSLRLLLAGDDELFTRVRGLAAEPQPTRIELAPANHADAKAFLAARLRESGGVDAPRLTPEALERLAGMTAGVARMVTLLCDRVVLYADLEELATIDEYDVQVVIEELRGELLFFGPDGGEQPH